MMSRLDLEGEEPPRGYISDKSLLLFEENQF